MKARRLVAVGMVAFSVTGLALGVVPGTVSAASAIEDYDTPSWFEERVADYFQYNWGDGEDTLAGIGKIDSWLWGDGTVCAVFPDGPNVPGDGEQCEEMQAMFIPSPNKVGAVFATKSAATGVKLSGGDGAATAVSGLMADLAGVAAGTVTVDTAVTDLAVSAGGVDGWVGGVNRVDYVESAGTGFAVIDFPVMPVFGSTSAFQVRVTRGVTGSVVTGGNIYVHNTDGSSGGYAGFGCDYRFLPCNPGIRNFTASDFGSKAFDHLSFVIPDGAGVGGTVTWYPPGHSLYEPALAGFIGTMESTYVCRTSTGSNNTYSRSVEVSSSEAYVDVSLERFTCPASELLMSALVEWVTPEATQVVYDYEAPSWVPETPAEWQNCGELNCELRLYDGTQYCGQYAIGCPEWFENPDDYNCKFGPYAVDLNYCAMYRKPGEIRPTGRVTVDEDGNLHHERGVDKDPSWFNEIDTDVKNHIRPTSTPEPTVPAGPGPKPGGGDPTPSPSKCYPSGWGVFNPFEWVYRPVTCALTWAFVPASDVVAGELTRGQESLAGHGVLGVIPAALDVPGDVAGGFSGGCTGGIYAVAVDTSAGELEASLPCSPGVIAPDFEAEYVTFRTLLGVVIVAGTAWGVFITVRAYFGGRDA